MLFVPCAFAKTYADLQEEAKTMFANHTDENLVALYEYAKIEMERRGLQPLGIVNPEKETTVPPGQYTVGKDIPVGAYTVKSAGTFFALMYIYSPSGSLVATYNVTPSTNIGKLDLEEGQTLQFTGDTLTFSPYKGLGF
jgi:hypothetical protein